MKLVSRPRRAVVLLALALAAGGLAASQVHGSVEEVESRVGEPAPVVVVDDDIRAGARFRPSSVEQKLAVRQVPERFVPPDSLASPQEAVGLRAAVPVAAGSYLTTGHLETGATPGPAGPPLAPGERIVEVGVAGGESLPALGPGTRVDVLVTTGGETGGRGRTYVALQSVELVDIASRGAVGAAASGTIVALRVTLRQAVMLTAAQSFAREIRLLARSRDDDRRVGRTSVEAADL